MSSTSNYGDSVRMPGRDVIFHDGLFWGDLTVNTINGSAYPPGGGAVPTLVTHKVLKTNGVPAMEWGDITANDITGGSNGQAVFRRGGVVMFSNVQATDIVPGTVGQVLVTGLGPSSTWSSNPSISGSLTVAGGGTFNSNVVFDQAISVEGIISSETGITTPGYMGVEGNITVDGNYSSLGGDIVLGTGILTSGGDTMIDNGGLVLTGGDFKTWSGSPGVVGMVLYSDGPGNPPYWDDLPSSQTVAAAQYYDNTIYDMNGAASVDLFANASVDISSPVVSFGAGIGFTVSRGSVYNIVVTLLCASSLYRTQVNLLVDGAFKGSVPSIMTDNGASQPLVLTVMCYINSGSVITVTSEPLVAGVMNTSGGDNHGIATSTIRIMALN